MTTEKNDGKVLFVDDESVMRDLLSREAQQSGILDFEVFEDAASAVARLQGLDEAATAIFSDGLNGGWREVIAAAKEAQVPAIILSGDTRIQQEVEQTGAIFLSKSKVNLGFVATTLDQLQHPTDA